MMEGLKQAGLFEFRQGLVPEIREFDPPSTGQNAFGPLVAM
jgi:hypothetical protein